MIVISLILIAATVVAFLLLRSPRCRHVFSEPERYAQSEWRDEIITHPALPGEEIRVYRRDVDFLCHCRKCGQVEHSRGYDTKPHETDPMHRTPEDFEPEPMPAPLSEEEFRRIRPEGSR
jgi:hypothetical protein